MKLKDTVPLGSVLSSKYILSDCPPPPPLILHELLTVIVGHNKISNTKLTKKNWDVLNLLIIYAITA